MTPRIAVVLALCLTAACNATATGPDGEARFLAEVPEGVLEIAAPWQDLTAVVLRPEDGCYWYEHTGPVETTLLPLRTREGRPICTRPAEPPPEPAAA